MDWTFSLYNYTFGILDIVIVVLCLLFAVKGAIKGLVGELSHLTGIVVGLFISILFSKVLFDFVLVTFEVKEDKMIYMLVSLACFIFLALLGYLVIYYIGKLVKLLISAIHLDFIDNILGFVYGVFFASFLISAVLYLFTMQKIIDISPLINNSYFTSLYINDLFIYLYSSVKDNVRI